MVESDAQVVINAINNKNNDESYFGLVIEDCRTLAANFSYILFQFSCRIANNAAHVLATHALNSCAVESCGDNISFFLNDVIEAELA